MQANITVRQKDGGYQAILSYKVKGKWKQKTKQGFKKAKDAKKWAQDMQFKLQEDIRDNIDIASEMTFEELLLVYLDYHKANVKETTYMITKSSIDKMVREMEKSLLEKEVNKIKPIEIANYFQKLKEETGKDNVLLNRKLKTIFNFAIKELKVVRENPVNLIKQTKEDKRIKYISKELYEEILSDEKLKESEKLLLKVLYNTGLRISEAMGITKDSILPDRIIVDKQYINGGFSTLKTKNSYREVPIPLWLYNELSGHPVISIDKRIFLFHKTSLSVKIKKYNTSLHCFRHTFATNLIAKGINLKVASEILGDNFETFINTYVQTSEDEKEKAFKFLSQAD